MRRSLLAWLQAAPLAAVFVVFFLLPLALIVMVSFWQATDYELIPAFTLQSYADLLSEVTVRTYVSTLKFSLLTWLTSWPSTSRA
jgi:putative spermidine/putrescine transport system permease protein